MVCGPTIFKLQVLCSFPEQLCKGCQICCVPGPISFISNSTFHQMQRLYCMPAVDEWWEWMRGELIEQFRGEKQVLCGDGQCDSPGFSAKNLCYFIKELVSEYILEVEVACDFSQKRSHPSVFWLHMLFFLFTLTVQDIITAYCSWHRHKCK